MNKSNYILKEVGIINQKNIKYNLSIESLVEDVILNKEGSLGMNGAVMVDTGKFTGRSPKDKYIVDEDSSSNKIWWGPVNKKVNKAIFEKLYEKVIDYYNKNNDSNTYIFDGFAGADEDYSLNVKVIAKKAWQAHFCNNMFIRRSRNDTFNSKNHFTIINASDCYNESFLDMGLNSETFILFHLKRKIAIIGGTEYGGEMKKGIFSVLHYLLPIQGVLSMHCSANVDINGDNTALFFGLSGTGKTTLSTDPKRPLIGDDEHGWSDNGIFNFEGGCYAKVINLDKDAEPDIFKAIRHGALLENVVFDPISREIDFFDGSKTENTRVSYPLEHIQNSILSSGKPSIGPHPKTIIFLTCDAYGVLPSVSKLTPEQAMYHFISGYTAKVAGTERGITAPEATFSPCFGGPFLTQHPLVYAELLSAKIKKFNADVYLVNTGWIGGSPESGAKRISIGKTRSIITSILDGSIEKSEFRVEPIFQLSYPINLKNIDLKYLDPSLSWDSYASYQKQAHKLANLFVENFNYFGKAVEHIKKAGPQKEEILL